MKWERAKHRNFITLFRTPASQAPDVTIDTQGAP